MWLKSNNSTKIIAGEICRLDLKKDAMRLIHCKPFNFLPASISRFIKKPDLLEKSICDVTNDFQQVFL
jgi:hypothetical protein